MIHEVEAGYVKVETDHGITTIEFHHPLGNSLPSKILQDLAHQVHAAGNDASTRVIILRSAGEKVFCSGASFEELSTVETEEQGRKFFMGFAHLINEMRKCNKFIIARIQGKCVGGGVGLAAAADYAIATEQAEVKLSELMVGIGPFVVGPVVERKIGLAAYSQLAIDAAMWRPADWARRKGLFAELHPRAEEMDESIDRLANQLSHSSPAAMSELKRVFWHGTEHWDELLAQRAAISGRLILSQHAREALSKLAPKKN